MGGAGQPGGTSAEQSTGPRLRSKALGGHKDPCFRVSHSAGAHSAKAALTIDVRERLAERCLGPGCQRGKRLDPLGYHRTTFTTALATSTRVPSPVQVADTVAGFLDPIAAVDKI